MSNRDVRIKETIRLISIECDSHIWKDCKGCIFDHGENTCAIVSTVDEYKTIHRKPINIITYI